ncbi:hypothetical protein [Kordiimonas lacus]|uniref:Lipoprotein n=1 Tax=Kordiimonas lacus TaxID=637679 RepID=A0A1G6Y4L1_9PROT|nr:hypothetical protein [Kordiimonas lacus]SDD84893.1 hypothetical protein SAMN04488071_1470 [Kordiimonas lacus]
MKPINAIIMSAACLTLGACAISIEGEKGYHDYDGHDSVTVTLPNGDRDRFSCPDGTSSFVINKKDEGKGMVYGCRTNGTPMPTVED